MKINPHTRIIIGPPGTGKTSRLIDLAVKAVQGGTLPEYIGYVSFTRQAVAEARRRIATATNIAVEEFTGFRTLHAMFYWVLGIGRDQILDPEELLEVDGRLQETMGRGPTAKAAVKMYSHMFTYHRTTGTPLDKVWKDLHTERCGTEEEFLEWVQAYKAFKDITNRLDFADLIEQFLARGIRFPFAHLFIDEAQDFSPDQWEAVKQLAIEAGTVYVAGDGDQGIFEWAGACGAWFEALEGKREVLEQSYRVPRTPHLVASRILKAMGREPLYRPTEQQGSVKWLTSPEIESLPFDNGETWYILARNQVYMDLAHSVLMRRGTHFAPLRVSGKDTGLDKLRRRIRWYCNARDGKELTPYQRKELEKLTSDPDLEGRIREKCHWFDVLSNMPLDTAHYLRSTQSQWDNPKVWVGTFHGSKGAEADNVVLLGDCSRRVAESWDRMDPKELRVLYVAATRTKNNLYLIEPREKRGIPFWRFFGLNQDLTRKLL